MQKRWHLSAISKILSKKLENKQTNGCLNVTRRGYNLCFQITDLSKNVLLFKCDKYWPNIEHVMVCCATWHSWEWKSNHHFVDATSRGKSISLDPKFWDGGLQGNGFSSLFSSLRCGINRARHQRDIIYPKQCRMPALSDDVTNLPLKIFGGESCRRGFFKCKFLFIFPCHPDPRHSCLFVC